MNDTDPEPTTVEGLMQKYGLTESEARFALALRTGELQGDTFGDTPAADGQTIVDLLPERFKK